MKKLVLGVFLIVVIQACSQKIGVATVANTKWILTEWPGKALPTTVKATLNFDAEGKIGGNSFCNGYGGNTTFENGGIKFSQIFGTKMYCEQVGDAENKYTTDLEAVNGAKLVGEKLQLLKDDQVLMIFTKAE
ncbi:META domain-containing protein [Pedobacter polaris]|uniref:META domain-containing protein n=1 Tax=Pedobacter polaris TaxID=2571273 RepID=A0A4V6WN87_9SPHI|nr:META domain-containing protein [Pedobacter polaris]TKC12462.1 META domain-containing protein [Pedobacter polaris]